MDDFDEIESREFERILPNSKGILGQLRILERKSDGAMLGIVTFFIAAGPASPIRGTELFNEMMDFFGPVANIIHGVWRRPPSADPSTNIDKVNELTSQGLLLEEAIQHAWTVSRAGKRGFGAATVLGFQGTPGNYIAVDVEIRNKP